MGCQIWISYTYSGGGGAAGTQGVPHSGCSLGNFRGPANSRRSYLSFLSMANETMKIICLKM